MNTKELRKLAEEAKIQTELYVDEISNYDRIDLKQWKEKITATNRRNERIKYDAKIVDWKEECKKIEKKQTFWSEKEEMPDEPSWIYFDIRLSDYPIFRFYLSGRQDKSDERDISIWYEPLSQEILERLLSAQKSHQFKRFEIWKIEKVKNSPIIMVGFSCWLNKWGYYEDATHLEDEISRFIYKICEWNSTE